VKFSEWAAARREEKSTGKKEESRCSYLGELLKKGKQRFFVKEGQERLPEEGLRGTPYPGRRESIGGSINKGSGSGVEAKRAVSRNGIRSEAGGEMVKRKVRILSFLRQEEGRTQRTETSSQDGKACE